MKLTLFDEIPHLHKRPCERCGIIEATVKLRDDCRVCGPTHLCDDCHEVHQPERNLL